MPPGARATFIHEEPPDEAFNGFDDDGVRDCGAGIRRREKNRGKNRRRKLSASWRNSPTRKRSLADLMRCRLMAQFARRILRLLDGFRASDSEKSHQSKFNGCDAVFDRVRKVVMGCAFIDKILRSHRKYSENSHKK